MITWASWCLKSLAIWLFVQELVQANNKEHSKALHNCPILGESTHGNFVDSPHKGPVMQKVFPCCAIIMITGLHLQPFDSQVHYRNWYQGWGHCCVTNDMGSSPQPEGGGRSPRAVVSFPGRWWRNNDQNGGINFYSIMMKQNQLQINKRMQGKCSKLPQNCLSYSMCTACHCPIKSCDLIVSPW